MEAINPLHHFLKAINNDHRVNTKHIAVYMTLYKLWLEKKCSNPIEIVSHKVMKAAKISSSSTWHKTIRSLDEYGYIRYEPTFNRMRCSKVYLIDFHSKI